MKYDKTLEDARRETNDLRSNAIMRFLKQQDHFKFNIGDILIKQRKTYSRHGEPERWDTDCTSVNSPKKYMYVFENELGIGYLKQLRVDGSGFTSQLICTVNFDPDNTRFLLDPDFVDHILLNEGDNFQYNQEYLSKKKFREEAILKNSKILIGTRSVRKTLEWFYGLKPCDEFWMGDTFDDLIGTKYVIDDIVDQPISSMPEHMYSRLAIQGTCYLQGKYRTLKVTMLTNAKNPYNVNNSQTLTADHFLFRKVTNQEPFPLRDELCGPPK